MRVAFLVIDVQNKFYNGDVITARSMDVAISAINTAAAAFRSRELPVFFIQHQEEDEGLLPGSNGFELHPALKVMPDDVHIVKTYGNAFNKTPLLYELGEREIDTVVLAGYSAEFCVLNTCRGAKDVDMPAFLLYGALASGHPDRICFVEDINPGFSLEHLEAFLDGEFQPL